MRVLYGSVTNLSRESDDCTRNDQRHGHDDDNHSGVMEGGDGRHHVGQAEGDGDLQTQNQITISTLCLLQTFTRKTNAVKYIFNIAAHQPHDVPRVTPAEGLAAGEGDGHYSKHDEGAEVGPQIGLHHLFNSAGEGEHTDHAEGEHQLEGQDTKHLQEETRDTLTIIGLLSLKRDFI